MDRAVVGQSDNSEAVLRLRPMEPADVTYLSDLWVASWRETLPDIDFEVRRDWLVDFLGDPAYATTVAEERSRLVGFVTLEATHLHQLVVAPQAKGQDVASRLMAAAKASAPAGLTLDVNQANARAIRFYEREGFQVEAAACNPNSGLAIWKMAWRPLSSRDAVA